MYVSVLFSLFFSDVSGHNKQLFVQAERTKTINILREHFTVIKCAGYKKGIELKGRRSNHIESFCMYIVLRIWREGEKKSAYAKKNEIEKEKEKNQQMAYVITLNPRCAFTYFSISDSVSFSLYRAVLAVALSLQVHTFLIHLKHLGCMQNEYTLRTNVFYEQNIKNNSNLSFFSHNSALSFSLSFSLCTFFFHC